MAYIRPVGFDDDLLLETRRPRVNYLMYECILRHLRLGPLQVYSLGFFSVLDDHRPAYSL